LRHEYLEAQALAMEKKAKFDLADLAFAENFRPEIGENSNVRSVG
jgi:hypothetical protein